MHEALETWPVYMLGRVLPRHLRIIFDINADFLASITAVHRPRRRADAPGVAGRRGRRTLRADGLPGGGGLPTR